MKIAVLVATIILTAAAQAPAQTTEFTYQGSLKVGASPTFAPEATVNYDFEFRLCTSGNAADDCATAPVLVGLDTKLNEPVTDGIFSVKLNFTAANAFDGSPRWLEISVRPAGGGAYTLLTPRQQLTSTPYAIKSKNTDNLGGIAATQYLQTNGNGSGLTNLDAGNITTGTLAVNRGGTGSATQNFVDLSTDQTGIGGNKTFTGDLTFNATTVRFYPTFGSGQFFIRNRTSSNFSAFVLVDDLNIYRGFFEYIGATAGLGARNDTVELGTNGKALTFRPNGSEIMRMTTTGNIGIGTGTPGRRLHIVDNGSNILFGNGSGCSAGLGAVGFASTLTCNNYSLLGDGVSTTINRPSGGGIFFRENNADQMTILAGGNVGIGTTSPASILHLGGNSGSFAMTFTNAANTVGRRGYRLSFDNDRFTFQKADDNGNFSANHLAIDQATGNVGIGTITPNATLEVNGDVKVTGTITGPRTNMNVSTDVITPNNIATTIPGLSQTVNVSGNAKLLVQFGVRGVTAPCLGCATSIAHIDLTLNGAGINQVEQSIANNVTLAFISGSWVIPVAAGSYTIEVKASSSGPPVNFGGYANNRSNLIVQVIPE